MPVESRLVRTLLNGGFALTAELVPPVSGAPDTLLEKAEALGGLVDAVNVTDGPGGRVHMSALAAAGILAARGIEPVLQFTCRDRNRIALQSDLLGAAALGVHNILVLRGDDPSDGDQTPHKAVFELQSRDLIRMAARMRDQGILPSSSVKVTSTGVQPSSRPIESPPRFFIGAADAPTRDLSERWFEGLRRKVEAGAQFIQTQFCFDIEVVRRYAARLVEEGLTDRLFILIGVGPLASAASARWMRDNLGGVILPDALIARMEQATDPKAEGIRICAELLRQLEETPGVSGAHLMAPVHPDGIPTVIREAGLKRRGVSVA